MNTRAHTKHVNVACVRMMQSNVANYAGHGAIAHGRRPVDTLMSGGHRQSSCATTSTLASALGPRSSSEFVHVALQHLLKVLHFRAGPTLLEFDKHAQQHKRKRKAAQPAIANLQQLLAHAVRGSQSWPQVDLPSVDVLATQPQSWPLCTTQGFGLDRCNCEHAMCVSTKHQSG